MTDNNLTPPANQDEIDLYCYLGEALCKVQILEQALNHFITLKMHSEVGKEEADENLGKLQTYTLGQAIKLGAKEKLYTLNLQNSLNTFLNQRNWLIHKAMPENIHDFKNGADKEKLFQKIKSISTTAEHIQRDIEINMIDFCESKGRNMSQIRMTLRIAKSGDNETN